MTGGVVAALLYARRAHRHPRPILDFSLLRIATFRQSVISGSFSRIGAGAQPFLLPMMLQVGFGDSPARSGLITFATSVGSLAMRLVAPGLLRRLGFRAVMVGVGALSALLLGACGGLRPAWPLLAVYALLAVGGFVQSLMFMAYNTIAYADIPRPRMSAATSFYTTFQQMALTLGIAASAGVLAGSVALTGHPAPRAGDFTLAFAAVALVAMMGPLASTRMDPQAGAELASADPASAGGGR